MEPIKVVLRYVDGRVLKGFTQNFYPNKDRFHLFPADKSSDLATEVCIRDLKALFIVRDFIGNPSYDEQKKLFRRGEDLWPESGGYFSGWRDHRRFNFGL